MPPSSSEMRGAASAKAAPIRTINTSILHDEIADRQASRVSKLYLVSFEMAATIARLAFGVAR